MAAPSRLAADRIWLDWLLPVGALLALAGYVGPWVAHPAAGLAITGRSPDGKLAEMVELPGHPYFVSCQFHPEFKSRPLQPHPLFSSFIRAGLERRARRGRTARDGAGVEPAGEGIIA